MSRSPWAIARPLIAGLALAVALPSAARGQGDPLDRVLDRLADSWARADAGDIAALVAEPGLSLAVDGEPMGPLGTRQAAAALRRIFEERETVELDPGMERVVGGAPPRAFGELNWRHRARGTTIPERTVVFIGLIREDDGWRLTEIRLLEVQ